MADTIIGSTIVIEGEIRGEEALILQGTVKGRVVLENTLVIEQTASVEGDIEVRDVEVAGKLSGNIIASGKVELNPDCSVEGGIRSPRLLIAEGASFKGTVDTEMDA